MEEKAAASNDESSSSATFQGKVASNLKFFHVLSTFTSRPELVIPNVRSTDLDWDSISPELIKKCESYESESVFDLLYSQIYNNGAASQSCHVGELCGPLYENTIKHWTENETKIELQRFIHHKPKDSKFGWTSKVTEHWDMRNNTLEVFPVLQDSNLHPSYPVFKATLKDTNICEITVKKLSSTETDSNREFEFYKNTVVPKLLEWMSDDYEVRAPRLTRQRARPLSYIQSSRYWYFYDLIKSGPAEYIKSIWQESTDPVKFIHEDIGIASYVASLIYDSRDSKFRPNKNIHNVDILDLGCGNGLLCSFLHEILSRFSKNSRVIGYDVRKRKIWENLLHKRQQFDENVPPCLQFPTPVVAQKAVLKLEERPIVPHLIDDLIKEYGCPDEEMGNRSLWLIGNHSDELTPWIPVIARRMNATGFLIIPCCPYDLFKKYQRRANLPGSSIYQNYIEYVCTLGDKFGYKPALENLRIPSTKKIALIGFDCKNAFSPGVLQSHVDEVMRELENGDEGITLAKFVPRSAESSKATHNIDRATAQPIIDKIFQLLISDWESVSQEQSEWYAGRPGVTYVEIMASLTTAEKEILKKKGNGLRTLVKSNKNIFAFEREIVKLRVPERTDIDNVSQPSRDKIKTLMCYFYNNHPQGCPLSADECSYRH